MSLQGRPQPVTTIRRLWKSGSVSEMREELTNALPMDRGGRPQNIAAIVAVWASDLSAYPTGTIMTSDDGVVNRGPMYR